jgi:hypothetical protein
MEAFPCEATVIDPSDPTYTFDPLRTFTANLPSDAKLRKDLLRMAERHTLGFFCIQLSIPEIDDLRHDVLKTAILDLLSDDPPLPPSSPNMLVLLHQRAQEDDNPASRDATLTLVRRLGDLARSGAKGASIMGNGRPLDLRSQAVVISDPGLDLSTLEGQATMYLCTAYTIAFMSATSRFNLNCLTEVYALTKEGIGHWGQRLMDDVLTQAARANSGMSADSQLARHFRHPELFTERTVACTNDPGAAQAALEFCGAEATPAVVARVQNLPVGMKFFRDRYGRMGFVDVLAPFDPTSVESPEDDPDRRRWSGGRGMRLRATLLTVGLLALGAAPAWGQGQVPDPGNQNLPNTVAPSQQGRPPAPVLQPRQPAPTPAPHTTPGPLVPTSPSPLPAAPNTQQPPHHQGPHDNFWVGKLKPGRYDISKVNVHYVNDAGSILGIKIGPQDAIFGQLSALCFTGYKHIVDGVLTLIGSIVFGMMLVTWLLEPALAIGQRLQDALLTPGGLVSLVLGIIAISIPYYYYVRARPGTAIFESLKGTVLIAMMAVFIPVAIVRWLLSLMAGAAATLLLIGSGKDAAHIPGPSTAPVDTSQITAAYDSFMNGLETVLIGRVAEVIQFNDSLPAACRAAYHAAQDKDLGISDPDFFAPMAQIDACKSYVEGGNPGPDRLWYCICVLAIGCALAWVLIKIAWPAARGLVLLMVVAAIGKFALLAAALPGQAGRPGVRAVVTILQCVLSFILLALWLSLMLIFMKAILSAPMDVPMFWRMIGVLGVPFAFIGFAKWGEARLHEGSRKAVAKVTLRSATAGAGETGGRSRASQMMGNARSTARREMYRHHREHKRELAIGGAAAIGAAAALHRMEHPDDKSLDANGRVKKGAGSFVDRYKAKRPQPEAEEQATAAQANGNGATPEHGATRSTRPEKVSFNGERSGQKSERQAVDQEKMRQAVDEYHKRSDSSQRTPSEPPREQQAAAVRGVQVAQQQSSPSASKPGPAPVRTSASSAPASTPAPSSAPAQVSSSPPASTPTPVSQPASSAADRPREQPASPSRPAPSPARQEAPVPAPASHRPNVPASAPSAPARQHRSPHRSRGAHQASCSSGRSL